MRLGNVVGMVVSTVKEESLQGLKLLVVEDADVRGRTANSLAYNPAAKASASA